MFPLHYYLFHLCSINFTIKIYKIKIITYLKLSSIIWRMYYLIIFIILANSESNYIFWRDLPRHSMWLSHHYQSIVCLFLFDFFILVGNWSSWTSSFLLNIWDVIVLHIFIFCKFYYIFGNITFLTGSLQNNFFMNIRIRHQDLTAIYSLIITSNYIFRFKSNGRSFCRNLLKLYLILGWNSRLSRFSFSRLYYIIT